MVFVIVIVWEKLSALQEQNQKLVLVIIIKGNFLTLPDAPLLACTNGGNLHVPDALCRSKRSRIYMLDIELTSLKSMHQSRCNSIMHSNAWS